MKNIFCQKLCKLNLYLFILFFIKNRIGGVFLTSLKNKIRVDNTLDKRLELFRQNATPEIRKLLFGKDQ
jgi:vacuolar-type H+-ATPase subunit E/Vma4